MFYDRPNYAAGPKINAVRLLPELSKRGYDVTAIIGYYEECPSTDLLRDHGISVVEIPWPKYCDKQVELLYPVLLKANPDIFVANISASGCYAGRFLRESGRPTIAGHLSDDEYNWGMAERFCKAGDAWAVSGMFCMGRELGDQVRNWKPKRTEVVDICHGVPLCEAATPRADGPLRMVYSGRMQDPQKRITDLTYAVIRVLQRHTDAEVMYLGEGDRSDAVARMFSENGLADRAYLRGYVDPSEVQHEMAWGNVLVLLSDFEGVPGAVMDGMAAGLVPICLDIPGGLRELVIHEETGLLVQDREQRFLDAASRLNADRALMTKLAAQARRHIEHRFSLTAAADQWESLFENVLKAAGPRKPIRFPRKPLLPTPFPKLQSQDQRSPSKSWLNRVSAKAKSATRSIVKMRATQRVTGT